MRIHALRHVPYEGLGHIGTWARAAGHRVTESRAWEGRPFPSPVGYDWLIVLGGPMSIGDAASMPLWLRAEMDYVGEVIEDGTATLGICLGAQLIASVLGGKVRRHSHPEIGWHAVEPTEAGAQSELAPFFAPDVRVMQWHYDTFDLPAGAVQLATSRACQQQAFSSGDRVLALQFHPEMIHDEVAQVVERDRPLPAGEFVQSAGDILVPARFDALGRTTADFLDRLAARWPPRSDSAAAAEAGFVEREAPDQTLR